MKQDEFLLKKNLPQKLTLFKSLNKFRCNYCLKYSLRWFLLQIQTGWKVFMISWSYSEIKRDFQIGL